MQETVIQEKAGHIRDVIRYMRRFKNALVIIYLEETLIDTPVFLSHIKDIHLLHEAGLRVIMVPGASRRIDEILSSAKIKWNYHNGDRITSEDAMPMIKMAAFDVSNQVMTALAGEKERAVIGNWVRARGKGVIDGFDYATSGEIDKLEIDSIKTVLDSGFIPIFPCIGWSAAGKPYNISSIHLAQQIAVHLQADKLFYLLPGAEISNVRFKIPQSVGLSTNGSVPALNIEEVDAFLEENAPCGTDSENTIKQSVVSKEKLCSLLKLARNACSSGVTRVHILNGSLDGTLPCEIFSDLGSGTMIYQNNYGGIREMTRDDISAVLSLMQPFVSAGILLPRTQESLADTFQHYIVYEIDGAIRACASLIPYSDGQMEIAGVAVDKENSHVGIGPKLVSFLVEKAKRNGAKSVFILTTQTSDWFQQLGFSPSSDISSLPEKRKSIWTPERGSKLMRLNLQ